MQVWRRSKTCFNPTIRPYADSTLMHPEFQIQIILRATIYWPATLLLQYSKLSAQSRRIENRHDHASGMTCIMGIACSQISCSKPGICCFLYFNQARKVRNLSFCLIWPVAHSPSGEHNEITSWGADKRPTAAEHTRLDLQAHNT